MSDTKSEVPVSFMNRVISRQSELGLSDHAINKKMGAAFGMRFTSIKRGTFPIPIGDIPELAIVLALEPSSLLRHAMRERAPDLMQIIDQYMRPSELTPREAHMLAQFRNMVTDEVAGPMVYEVTTHRAMIIDSVRRMPGEVEEDSKPSKVKEPPTHL